MNAVFYAECRNIECLYAECRGANFKTRLKPDRFGDFILQKSMSG